MYLLISCLLLILDRASTLSIHVWSFNILNRLYVSLVFKNFHCLFCNTFQVWNLKILFILWWDFLDLRKFQFLLWSPYWKFSWCLVVARTILFEIKFVNVYLKSIIDFSWLNPHALLKTSHTSLIRPLKKLRNRLLILFPKRGSLSRPESLFYSRLAESLIFIIFLLVSFSS